LVPSPSFEVNESTVLFRAFSRPVSQLLRKCWLLPPALGKVVSSFYFQPEEIAMDASTRKLSTGHIMAFDNDTGALHVTGPASDRAPGTPCDEKANRQTTIVTSQEVDLLSSSLKTIALLQ
jgi:hypothetical protein